MKLAKLTFIVVCLTVLMNCGGGIKFVNVTSLIPISEVDSKVTRDGVTVTVTPVNNTNISSYPQLSCEFNTVVQGLLGPTNKKMRVPNVLPGVTFAVKAQNNTGHIIRMSGSEIGLTVGGNDANMMSKEEVLQNLSVQFMPIPPEVMNTVNRLKFWDESAKTLPGRSADFFVTFDIPLTEGIGQATVLIYDLVTETDQAGNPTKRTNFDFNFKELTTQVKK